MCFSRKNIEPSGAVRTTAPQFACESTTHDTTIHAHGVAADAPLAAQSRTEQVKMWERIERGTIDRRSEVERLKQEQQHGGA